MLHICLIGIILSMQIDTLKVFNDSASIKDNSISVEQKKIEPNNIQTPDTIFASFNSDTINLEHPVPVSQVIYAEHKESSSVFYGIIFPIIMLFLGVIIDRSIQTFIDSKRIKRNGKRWRIELQSCVPAINNQLNALSEFKTTYCDDPLMFEIPDIFVYPFLNGKEFSSLNKEDLYEFVKLNIRKQGTIKYNIQSITKNGRDKIDELAQERFYKIATFLMSLEMIYNTHHELFGTFKESSGRQIELFNDIQLKYSQMLISLNRSEQTSFSGQLMLLFETAFKNHPKVNLFELEESFISPSLSLLSKFPDSKYQGMIDKLINMRYCINGLKLEKTYLADGIDGIVEQYNQCLVATEALKTYLKT